MQVQALPVLPVEVRKVVDSLDRSVVVVGHDFLGWRRVEAL